MSSATKSKPEGLLGLTQGEARLILLGVLYTDSSGKIDYEKLAANAPYKNVQSASSSYRQARKRLNDEAFKYLNTSTPGNAENSSPIISTPTKRTPAKRKRAPAAIDAVAANDYVEDEDVASPTPKQKRQRKSTRKKDATVKTEAESDDHTEPSPTIKPESELLDLNRAIKSRNEDTPMNIHVKTEEEAMMTELNVDAEFEAMG